MSDEIKDKNGLEEEKSPNLENSSTESEQDAAEDANEEISTEEHSDYKPVNRHLHVGEQTNNYTERYEHRQCAMHPLD